MPHPPRGRLLLRLLLSVTTLACGESPLATTHASSTGATPATPAPALTRVDCAADVRSRTVSCAHADSGAATSAPIAADRIPSSSHSASPAPASSRDIILGGQNQFITLASSNVAFSGDIFSFDATVQNLIAQKLGTIDGSTLATSGLRVFFQDPPVVTAGTGAVDFINPVDGGSLVDGFGTFTASNQPYYEYDQLLLPGQMSAARTWRLHLPLSVLSFQFSVYVSAPVQFPTGSIDVYPPTSTLPVTETHTLIATVHDVAGRTLSGETIAWSSSNPGVAAVDATSGLVSAISLGQATITATSTSNSKTRTGTATVIVAGVATRIDSVVSTTIVGTRASPQIKISDANGNAISGLTPTWSLGVCHARVSLVGYVFPSDSSGVATSPALMVPESTPLSCTIIATVPGVTNSPMTFSIYIPSSANSIIWTGKTSTDWSTATNWLRGVTPTATDDVFIPTTAMSVHLPTLTSPQSVASLATEPGAAAALSLGANVLTATGNVYAFSPITATTGGMQLSSTDNTNPATVRGQLPATTIGTTNCASGGAYMLGFDLTIAGQLTVQCTLKVGANYLYADDLLVQGNGGILEMRNLISVTNVIDATFSGANSNGHLTAGTLYVRGNLRQRSAVSDASFSPTGAHLTWIENSTVNDSIYFQSTDTTAANLNTTSHFANLRISTAPTHKTVFVGYGSGDPHGLNSNLHVAGNLTIDKGDPLHIESVNQQALLKVRGTATLNGVLRTTGDGGNGVGINVDGALASNVDSTGHLQLDAPAGTTRIDVGGSFTLQSTTGSDFTGLASLTVRGAQLEYDASGGVFPGTVSMVSSSAQTFRVPASTLFNAVHDSTTGTLTVRNGFVTETLVIGVNSRLSLADALTTIQLGRTVNGSGGSIFWYTGSFLDLSGGALGNIAFRTLSGRSCQYKVDANQNPLLAGGGDALRWLAALPTICIGSTSLAAAPFRPFTPLGVAPQQRDGWVDRWAFDTRPFSQPAIFSWTAK